MYLMTDNLTLGGNMSYTQANTPQIHSFRTLRTSEYPTACFQLSTSTTPKGNQVLNVPDYKGSVFAMYSTPLDAGGQIEPLTSHGSLRCTTPHSWMSMTQRLVMTDSTFEPPWTSDDEAWVVAGYINNVMDKIGIRQLEAMARVRASAEPANLPSHAWQV